MKKHDFAALLPSWSGGTIPEPGGRGSSFAARLSMSNDASIAQAAREYAGRGWLVLPVHGIAKGSCTCGSVACPSAGKHPLHAGWPKNATTDQATIAGWFEANASANVGVKTGIESGLVVVDVDPRNGGDKSVQALKLPPTLTAATGGGGWHYFYRLSESLPKKGSALPGVDLQAGGAFVVMAPSIHASGKRYELHGSLDEIVAAPEVVLGMLRKRDASTDKRPKRRVPLSEVRQGERNETLFKIVCGFAQGARFQNGLWIGGCACRSPKCEKLDHLFSRAMGVNRKFPVPLEADEVRLVCRNALRKAKEGRQAHD